MRLSDTYNQIISKKEDSVLKSLAMSWETSKLFENMWTSTVNLSGNYMEINLMFGRIEDTRRRMYYTYSRVYYVIDKRTIFNRPSDVHEWGITRPPVSDILKLYQKQIRRFIIMSNSCEGLL